jgi:hypothetical protein
MNYLLLAVKQQMFEIILLPCIKMSCWIGIDSFYQTFLLPSLFASVQFLTLSRNGGGGGLAHETGKGLFN